MKQPRDYALMLLRKAADDLKMMEFSDRILPLTPYAIQMRYADEDLLVEKDAVRAFEAAEEVYRFTVRQLGLGYEQPEDWYID